MTTDYDYPICPRCKCCSMDWEECAHCDDGFVGHDCGEDCCCCADPEPNIVCDVCGGKCGWYTCTCDKDGKHGGKK
jgi:hypothetical protein